MAIEITDHGTWQGYTPDPYPDWALDVIGIGGTVVFIRRESDGMDWYVFLKTNPFQADELILTTTNDRPDGGERINQVFWDPTKVFPFNQRLLAVKGIDASETKPHNLLIYKNYDPVTKLLSGEPGAPSPAAYISVADYQFAGQAAAEKIITDDAAMDWVATGKTPDNLIAAVKQAVTDPERQKRVLLFLAGTTSFPRNHELTPLLAASFGKDTPEKVDAFFEAASKR